MWPKSPAKRADHGFTLLEILVALSVFAVITLLAYRGLDSISTTKQRLDAEMRKWRTLELIFERINMDVTQIAPRSWIDSSNKERSSVQGSSSNTGAECQLDVMRFGNDRIPIHLRYWLKNGSFWLDIVPDATNPTKNQTMDPANQQHYLLLDNVEKCELAFMDTSNVWQSYWPLKSLTDMTRPRGIRLRLTQQGQGMLERVYYLP